VLHVVKVTGELNRFVGLAVDRHILPVWLRGTLKYQRLDGTRAGGNEGLNVEGLVKSLGGAVSSGEYEGHPVLSICVPLRPEL
jgi:hypothetical protein